MMDFGDMNWPSGRMRKPDISFYNLHPRNPRAVFSDVRKFRNQSLSAELGSRLIYVPVFHVAQRELDKMPVGLGAQSVLR